MAKVLNKVMGFLGLEDEEDEYEETEEEVVNEETAPEIESIVNTTKRQSKVVNIHTAASAKVVICKPKDFDEVTYICDNLKSRKIVVVNTSELDPKVAQRLLDFMGGSSYALAGDLQEVEKSVYILSPSNVEVDNELKSELSVKGALNWNR